MNCGSIRLLVVEDNPSDVWLLREAFRLAEFSLQMTVAHDGLEAIQYLRQIEAKSADGPDLVLLDLNLPRKSGRDVLDYIRRSRALQTLPTVVLTGSRSEDDKRQALKLKATGFFSKPDSLPGYVEMIRALTQYWSAGGLRRTA